MIDSNADTIPNGISNPCDSEGCTLPATHRVRLHESRWLSHVEAEYCDEHMQVALKNGAKHLEWLDQPRVEGER